MRGFSEYKKEGLKAISIEGKRLNNLLKSKLGKINENMINYVNPQFFMGFKNGKVTKMRGKDYVDVELYNSPVYIPTLDKPVKKIKLFGNSKVYIFSNLTLQPYDKQSLIYFNGDIGYVDTDYLDLSSLGDENFMENESTIPFKYDTLKLQNDLMESFKVYNQKDVFLNKSEKSHKSSQKYDSATIISKRAYFYDYPNFDNKRKAYLIEGEVLEYTDDQNGFVYTVFINAQGQKSIGWISKDDIKIIQNKKY